MAHPQETKDKLRGLYIEGLSLSSSAIAADISYDTARQWKKDAKKRGDDWDSAKSAYLISDKGIESLNQSMVETFAKNCLTVSRELDSSDIDPVQKSQIIASLADAYAKFSKSFARINPQFSSASIALDTVKTIIDHLREHDTPALKLLSPHFDAITALLREKHGG